MVKLSVIIPTFNRPDLLKISLGSILRQEKLGLFGEVIVVDNGPSRDSHDCISAFQQSSIRLRYLEEPCPGLHAARHRGMREAIGDFLVYVDDDIEALPGWIEGVWRGFHKYEAVLVGGRNLPKWEGIPPDWLRSLWEDQSVGKRCLAYLSILDLGGQTKDVDPAYVWGCNFAIRKTTLLEAGGFHPDSMPHELLQFRGDGETYVSGFVASKGYKAIYVPEAAIYHHVPKERMTMEYFYSRAFLQGISDSFAQLRGDPSRAGEPIKGLRLLERLLGNWPIRSSLRFLLPSDKFLRAMINRAYRDGFLWHRNRFMNDEQVRNWVLRADYLQA